MYEAILATLAILIWHFYQVMFDPDVYPMNWAWWNGRMSVEHYKDEHTLDSETILQAMQQSTGVANSDEAGVTDRREMPPGNDAPPHNPGSDAM